MTIKYQVRSSSLLIYDNRVCGLAKQLKPSARGELEITDLNKLYLTPIIQNLITLKQSLNNILTGSEQEKKHIKRKIRKDFYKVKQELGLTNYIFEDLRFSNLDN